MIIECANCGRETTKPAGHVNRSIKNGYKLYCSGECFSKGLSRTKTVHTLSYRNRKKEEAAGRPAPDKCEVCGGSSSANKNLKHRMHFDHDHATGKFRGWICGSCNRVLGLVKDNPDRLRHLAQYLESFKCQ